MGFEYLNDTICQGSPPENLTVNIHSPSGCWKRKTRKKSAKWFIFIAFLVGQIKIYLYCAMIF